MRFEDIKPFTRDSAYQVNVPWDTLEEHLARLNQCYGLELDPDFQRAHVWNETQQVRYVEYVLRGGKSSRDIYFNSAHWGRLHPRVIELVDGKQRLEAVRRFLRNEITAVRPLTPGI